MSRRPDRRTGRRRAGRRDEARGAREADGGASGLQPDWQRPEADARGGADLETLARVAERIRASVERVIEGKPEVVPARPGRCCSPRVTCSSRTSPASARRCSARRWPARIDCSVRRIQFTPDLLPSDVTGVSVFNQDTREFEFRPGGVFANIVVGDEINRASPKTQSALLECMEERQVTVDGTTYQLDAPFMVIATQNPIEMEGTYALPEAQRDRFMARVSMGYPVEAAEIAMLDSHTGASPLDDLEPVTDAAEVRKLIEHRARRSTSPRPVQRYAVALTTATRRSPELPLGRLPAGHAAPGARRQGARPRIAGPRLRAARRRPRRSRVRCSPTGCCPPSRPR